MKTAKKKRFRVMSVFMCFLILISGILVIMGSIRSNQVAAANEITFYFDSSCLGKDNDWGTKTPDHVYFYAYKSTNNTGIKQMDPVSGKTGSDGGKLYKGTVAKDLYSYLIILKNDHWSNKEYQTLDYSLNNVKDKDILILNTSGYNVGNDGYVQGMYVKGTFEETTNYSSQKFSILNMDDQNVTLQIKYSTLTKKYENGQWTSWNSTEGVEYSTSKEYTIPARHYQYKQFEVPARDSGEEPWQSVHICTSNGTEIKKYYFPEGKILGRSFFYGVTDFQSTNPAPMDYGDGTKLCYITSDLGSLNSTSYELYFDKNFFTSDSAPQYGKISTPSGSYSIATALTKDGNAKYVTDGNVSLNSWSRQGDNANDIDLSKQIMSVEYNGVQYNLFAPQNEGDNLVKVNDNVAVISGKYTVQSTGNVLTEDGHDYNYITTQADFYDYQYDHNSTTDDSYTYYTVNAGNYLVFSKTKKLNDSSGNHGWKNDIYAYFIDSNNSPCGGVWPGSKMTWIGKNSYDQHRYKINIPTGAAKAIINNGGEGKGNQTVDISIEDGEHGVGVYDEFENNNSLVPVETFDVREPKASLKGKAKRPYLTINEAISGSDYANSSTNYPMYLGQFWLPKMPSGTYSTSQNMYTASTAYQRAAHNHNNDEYNFDLEVHDSNYDSYYDNFGFGNTLNNFNWSANLAFRYTGQEPGTYEPYDAVVQGLVKNQLQRDSNTGEYKLMANDNSNTIPYFDMSWWDQSYSSSDGKSGNLKTNQYIKPYENYAFPFFETAAKDVAFKSEIGIGTGTDPDTNQTTSLMVSDRNKTYRGKYYVFDSSKNVIRVNQSQQKLDMYYNKSGQHVNDNYGNGDTTHEEVGLFPFNSNDSSSSDYRGENGENLHYGFGVKFSMDFFLNENGTLDGTTDGIPITFTFQGDDDVWVFLDDQLILDMGGAHKNAIGEINFKDKKVYVGAASGTVDTSYVTSVLPESTKYFDGDTGHSLLENSSALQNTATVGRHKITMYYLERGMLNSNLYVMFNLPLELTKYDLQTDTDFTGINTGFKDATKKVAENDVFNYSIENKGTSASKVLNSEYKYPSNTAVERTNSEVVGNPRTTLSTSGSATQTTHNYQGSPGSYQPMMSNDTTGVTYQLTEPYFGGEGVTTFDTRSVTTGSTTAKGVVSMQYGEMATFSKQLEGGSQMKVKLLDTLSAPVSGSRANSYKDSTGRKASDYYVTHYKQDELASNGYRRYAGIYRGDDVAAIALKHVDPMYDRNVNASAKNYSTNHVINPQVDNGELQFVFADPKNAADGYVYLRQVVVNEVKTVKLRISKDILANEKCDDKFDFKIVFSNIFGANTGDSDIDYDRIAYKKYNSDGTKVSNDQLYLGDEDHLNNDGSFSLEKGQYIEIENIPVMTKYYLTEESTSTDFTLSDEYSVNMGSRNSKIVLNGDMSAVVTNKRTTGTIQVQKLVYDESGNLMNGNGSLTTEFTLMIGLKAPDDVNLDNYPIKFMQDGSDLIATSKAVKLTAAQLTSYPSDYPAGENWAVYNVTVKANRAANGALRLNIQNVPYETVYKVHERSVPLGFVIPTTKPTNSVWTQADYNYNTSGTYANVMYKDSAKTLDSTVNDVNDLVTVENNLNPIEMPSTGGSGVVLIFPLGILAIVLSGAAVMIYKRKIDNGSILRKGRYMK